MRYCLSHAYRSSCSILRLQLPGPLQIPAAPIRHHYHRFSTPVSSPELLSVRDIPAPHIGHIRVISLRSPHNRNALSSQLITELRHQINSLRGKRSDGSAGGTRALVLASELDEAFCAGADLKERSRMSDAETFEFVNGLRATFRHISTLLIPTISAVSSVALGGGLELALSTDLRVFSAKATVGLPETRLGIVPGAGGVFRLRSLIGRTNAQQLILTGMSVSGSEALRMGFCNFLVHHSEEKNSDKETGMSEDAAKPTTECLSKRRQEVLDKALEVADRICQGAPVAVSVAYAMTKRAQEMEDDLYKKCVTLGRKDRDEGLLAFKQKRPPVYRGVYPGYNSGPNSMIDSFSFDQLANAASSAYESELQPGDLELVENAWNSGEQGLTKQDLEWVEAAGEHVPDLKRSDPTEPKKPMPVEVSKQSWDSDEQGLTERDLKRVETAGEHVPDLKRSDRTEPKKPMPVEVTKQSWDSGEQGLTERDSKWVETAGEHVPDLKRLDPRPVEVSEWDSAKIHHLFEETFGPRR